MPEIGSTSNFNGQDFVYEGVGRGWAKVSDSPTSRQVGGDHYKDMAIQPIEYILANELPFIEGAVVKYVSRWRKKGGVSDLGKAIHLLEILIERETGK